MASVLQVGTRERRKFQDPDGKVADLPETYRFIWILDRLAKREELYKKLK